MYVGFYIFAYIACADRDADCDGEKMTKLSHRSFYLLAICWCCCCYCYCYRVYCDCFGSFAARVAEFAHASGRPYLLHTMCTCCPVERVTGVGGGKMATLSCIRCKVASTLWSVPSVLLPGLPGCNPFLVPFPIHPWLIYSPTHAFHYSRLFPLVHKLPIGIPIWPKRIAFWLHDRSASSEQGKWV